MNVDKPTCRTCVYWRGPRYKDDQEGMMKGHSVKGECRRHAESFPERYSDCWCGEHNDFPRYVALMSEETEAKSEAVEYVDHNEPLHWIVFPSVMNKLTRQVHYVSTECTDRVYGGAGSKGTS